MRLGDLDALKDKLKEIFDTVEVVTFDDIIATIDNAPTISPYKAIHDELHKGEEE